MKMNKINLTDVTFLIPIKLDSIDRLLYLKIVVEFLLGNFNTHIHILEADGYDTQFVEKLLPKGIRKTFVEDFDPIFHRTKYINQMVKECKTPIVSVWDADVLTPVQQIVDAVELIRNKNSHFSSPYEHDFLDTTSILRDLYLKSGSDMLVLMRHKEKMKKMYSPNPVGGAFFANTNTYHKTGLENETFYGWGPEDHERVSRWTTLGYDFGRIIGCAFHLTHSRGITGNYQSEYQKKYKLNYLKRFTSLTKDEVQKEFL